MSATRTTHIAAAGDVFVDRGDPDQALKHIRAPFRACEVVFANLEGVYSNTQERAPSAGVPVVADPSNAAGVVRGGFTVVSLANNHSLDGGSQALLETRRLMRDHGIVTAGAGENLADARRPAILETSIGRVAILAYASVFPHGYEARAEVPGLAPLRAYTHFTPWEPNEWNPGILPRISTTADEGDLEAVLEDIASARADADLVLVSFHWGDFTRPYVLTDHEVRTARTVVDAGADAVLGHHHLLRAIEIYRGKPIYYGLGHFAFDLPGLEERLRKAAYLGRGNARRQRESLRRFGEYRIGPREGYPLLPFHPDGRLTGFAVLRASADGAIEAGFVPCTLGPDNSPHPMSARDADGSRVIDYLERCCAEEDIHTDFIRDGYELGGVPVTIVRPAS